MELVHAYMHVDVLIISIVLHACTYLRLSPLAYIHARTAYDL